MQVQWNSCSQIGQVRAQRLRLGTIAADLERAEDLAAEIWHEATGISKTALFEHRSGATRWPKTTDAAEI